MPYLIDNNFAIQLFIPAVNSGKFRFKKRDNNISFGKIFSTRDELFDDKTYLEWQIGYDIEVKKAIDSDISKDLRNDNFKFKASNGKDKYPYELSELLFVSVKIGLLSKKDIESLLSEIKSYKNFIDQKAITVERHSKININGINYEETSIKLPTLFMVETEDKTQIEVSIQKQQYASGVQPMIYFCIPFCSFYNFKELKDRSSKNDEKLIYIINKSNIKNFEIMVKVFGMSSMRHKYDIMEILGVLLKNLDNINL